MTHPACDEVPFGAIVSITNRGRFVFLNSRLKSLGLSAGQFPVLMLLSREQNIMQERLVRHYHLDKGTIARSVKKLEDAGYVRRIVDPDNRRAVRLFLTEKGERVLPALRAINSEWEERISEGLTVREREEVSRLMLKVVKNSCHMIQDTGGEFDD